MPTPDLMTPSPLAKQRTDFRAHVAELRALSPRWRQQELFARLCPDAIALLSRHGLRTHYQLHANADRLAWALHARGLRPGDALALQCSNRPEFVEVLLAAMRLGLRLTPISTQLGAEETAYIVADCDARLLFAEVGLAGAALTGTEVVVIGTPAFDALLHCGAAPMPLDGGGRMMMYTSGTTGRPKGVRREGAEFFEPQYEGTICNYRPGDVQLCAGPAYHAAPLLIDIRWPLVSGVPIVLMDKWDTRQVLAAMAAHRVSCAHMVPTMLRRLMDVPADERARHDLSSLRLLVHGAAPCPVALKQALIDWLGPVLWEYYGATEGGEGINVSAEDWLRRPGTVGRLDPRIGHRIVDDEGRTLGPHQVGQVLLASRPGSFAYHKDAAKNDTAFQHGGLLLGDLGYVDEDGWLFLTGRSAETVISGGVNIYPAEVDEALRGTAGVLDVACVGAPDAEWGERLLAVVVPAAGQPPADVEAALRAEAEAHLASFKRPRAYVFVDELPYSGTGKLLRGSLRARFWPQDGQQI